MAIVAGMPHGGMDNPGVSRRTVMPAASALAALGPVLCMHRPGHGNELVGWSRAVHTESRVRMDSEDVIESLHFFDAAGGCCWRLYLLPDSDFLAWDRLQSRLPGCCDSEPRSGIADRLWQRLAGTLRGGAWQLSAVRLHALREGARVCMAASATSLSLPGIDRVRRIACIENVGPNHLPALGGFPSHMPA
ncbi:MAG TPA: Hemin transport protein [Xanthomonadaceae bacterium]|nr:Hemin transport protein [Xanthomonadaceae bacterium]